MRKTTAITLALLVLLSFLFFMSPVGKFVAGIYPLVRPAPSLPPSGESLPFMLPEGFATSVYAEDVSGARVMVRDPKGVLLVSETGEGKVVALPNLDADGKADRVITVLEGLDNPHGLLVLCSETGFESVDQDDPSRQSRAEADCTLYVAESHRVAAYRYDVDTYSATFKETLLELPADGGHSTRALMLHPDNKRILVSIGSSCNVCTEEDERRAAILALDPSKEGYSVFARGLRNTVFMTTHYVTGDIWGTEMGRDLLDDDLPPDEMNIIREGGNYGWPICYGKNVHDTDFDKNTYIRNPCMEPFETPSRIDIPAHSAPLGLAFVPEEGWPEEWWYDALVAYHGSWNRSVPTGYKIVRFPLDAHGNPEGPAVDFMTGFMNENGAVIGRPVDILVEPGGTMYVSDDRAGAIYRISRTL
ncbi:hypothetical protein A2853_00230 [Candidatus Kaiserbacteria bacterium RIFCSPHIGHO2_01_FULL_55_17]|uniref:Pyrroloquinoline quinone-dependent pyranose dehydrogenase beta-propeller domain-containing protein n=1 Tax=Candidatus Kaiserbacteria bacterium RIFCSPHIGHO2_01_FULL_55_17 TaxID=1798484 RepID=A0A1F6DA70_9BACT|nr:MAG: hypothetical protein A2853_00230 [Candidatus Kaiserbacteria bacterium RIFCSPHIGHO2_01_FULL_55_17]